MASRSTYLFVASLLAGIACAPVARADEPTAYPAPPTGQLPSADVPAAPPPAGELVADEPVPAPAAPAPAAPAAADEPKPAAPPAPPEPPALEVVTPPPAAPPAPAPAQVVGTPSGACCAPPPLMCGTCGPSCCDPCRRPSLDLQIHGSWVNGLEGPITVDSGLANQVLWDPLDYGMSLGGRAAYHFAVGAKTATIGGTYWGFWEDEHTTVGTLASSNVPGGAPAVSPVFPVLFEAQTLLYGIDADISTDVVCTPCMRAGWGWGARYMRFDEEGTFTFFPVAGGNGQGHADVDNALLAAQLTGHASWRVGDRLELRTRAAAFVGWLSQKVETTSAGAFIPAGPDAEDDTVGFGGELEVEARWRLSNSWSIGVGYGLLVLFDQARAEQAFDMSQTGTGVAPGRIEEETILAHRVFFGVTFEF